MPCPICDQKPMNCDYTETEQQQYGEIEELRDEIARLRLTDAEREAVEWASRTLCVGWHDLDASGKQQSRNASATLSGLLERLT